MIIEYDGSNLDSNSILYFYASWNNYCSVNLEALERLNTLFNVKIIKINTTKYLNIKHKYSIKKIPSYVILENNNVIAHLGGIQNKYSLIAWYKHFRGIK